MAILCRFDYLFAIGIIFVFLDAFMIGLLLFRFRLGGRRHYSIHEVTYINI